MSQALRSVSREPGPGSSIPTTIVVAAFVLSRIVVLLLVLNPDSYPRGDAIAQDRDALYRSWSSQVVDEGQIPYSDTHIEYPPGALPFLILPGVIGTSADAYRIAFALMILVIDALGVLASLRIARRTGSRIAPWLWVIPVGILGPLAYARFDLVPAVMTAWALERAAHGRSGWAGGWMAAGGMAKIYPFLLLPLMFLWAPNRRRFALGAAAVVAAVLLPVSPLLADVWRDVGGYHLSRGIHVESLAGSVLFIASRQGLASSVAYSSGALHFTGDVAQGLRAVCDVAVLVVMAVGMWIVTRLPRGDFAGSSAAMLGTLCLALVASPVLSPQFMLWVIPFAVAAVTADEDPAIPWLLIPITVMTAAIFPFLYTELSTGAPFPVILLWGRNLSLIALGLLALRRAFRGGRLTHSSSG